MPRGKGKVIQKSIKDRNISDMFNQMIGTGNVDMNIVYPKYSNISTITTRLIKLFKVFNDGVVMKSIPDLTNARQEITGFIDTCEKEHKELFQFQDLSRYQGMFDMVSDEVKEEFGELYERSKESNMVRTFILVCDRLVEYKRHIEDVNNLSYKFINTMSGVDFTPLPFTSLNFKYLFSLDVIDSRGRDYLMLILNKIYTYSYDLYKEFSKPDINVDEFVKVILANMDEVKKRVPRCGKAFNKIAESVELLKSNFNGYYHDFVQTKNSSIIMEHFVLDVSRTTDADPETTRQFRKIINYYRKMTAGKIKDERVNYLFQKVDASFNEMDKFSNMKRDQHGEFDNTDSSENEESGGNDGGENTTDTTDTADTKEATTNESANNDNETTSEDNGNVQ